MAKITQTKQRVHDLPTSNLQNSFKSNRNNTIVNLQNVKFLHFLSSLINKIINKGSVEQLPRHIGLKIKLRKRGHENLEQRRK